MNIPFFFTAPMDPAASLHSLDEGNSRHALQVLRLRENDPLVLTDGLGHLIHARVASSSKKHCTVRISHTVTIPPPEHHLALGFSLLKNAARFEWLLEKVTELGIQEIIPLRCQRTERTQFRRERLQAVLISALLQSQQAWLPVLRDPVDFATVLQSAPAEACKLIAHCGEGEKRSLLSLYSRPLKDCLLLIGPEGDFTGEEITQAYRQQFQAVTLGPARLRSETAGITAAVLLKQLMAEGSGLKGNQDL